MNKKVILDLIVIIILTVLFHTVSTSFDLFEFFHSTSLQHENWELDEILITACFMMILWAGFSLRRWNDLASENKARRETENRLREVRESLEKKVELRTSELVTVNKEMLHTIEILEATQEEKTSLQHQIIQSQKLESIGLLASGIAHDFNNLLTAINGYADLVIIKTEGYGEDVREDLDKIRNAGNKASNLTKQLLAFSRKQVFNLKPLVINDLINEIIAMASRLIGEHIHVTVQLAHDIHHVNIDKTQIEQVLMNLLLNARDAMPKGGELTISTSNVTLDEEYAKRHEGVRPGDHVLISVADSGEGIRSDIQDKIFDPFFTTKESGKGTGLGLATVYGIVKQHKGNIWVYSEEGLGTTFKVYLPATFTQSVEDCTKEETSDIAAGKENILVVDDDEMVREFVTEALEFHNYSITQAVNGQEALNVLDKTDKQFDLFLTDVIMPHMNGWEFSQEVRKRDPSAKVLFMSGYDDKKIPKDMIESDPHLSFIAKPLTTTPLLKEIRKLLDS